MTIGIATIKRTVKQTTGWAAMLSRLFTTSDMERQACIFYYHRVANVGFVDSQIDDWNVTPAQFERQITTLLSFADIVPLADLPGRLADGSGIKKPLVSLTFDDGYANFHSQALPVLKRFSVPATAFVVTSSIGKPDPMPFDRWALNYSTRVGAEGWRALNWKELEDCVSSGLVTIGAHSHQHLRGSQCSAAQLADEVGHSREVLRSRLGEKHSAQYAYPYGNSKLGDVSDSYVAAVKAAGFEIAVTTDLGLVTRHTNLFTVPRLEAHMMDSPGVMKAKALGALAPYRLTDHLRAAYRA
ncbi:MAG TPA: polysaccharide deacetylase family protein [Pyrinomonadaceae bacterium]|nr:polysaccharide deacetylase family protein [Pyrinomonadaceae bacterium]